MDLKRLIESMDTVIEFMDALGLKQAERYDNDKTSENLDKFKAIEQANNTLKTTRDNIVDGLTKKSYK